MRSLALHTASPCAGVPSSCPGLEDVRPSLEAHVPGGAAGVFCLECTVDCKHASYKHARIVRALLLTSCVRADERNSFDRAGQGKRMISANVSLCLLSFLAQEEWALPQEYRVLC